MNDDILHEYLDNTLDDAQRRAVEAWLAQSPAARTRLAELQALFTTLDALDDAPLLRDLTGPVLAQLAQEAATAAAVPPVWTRWLPLAQLAAAVAMLVWLWPTLAAAWRLGVTAVAVLLAALPAQTIAWQIDWAAWWATLRTWLPQTPADFNLALGQWGLLLGVAFLAWLVGNRLLLTQTNGGPSHG